MATMSHRDGSAAGLIGALRQLRDPLLLIAFPITFAVLSVALGYMNSWPVGFDFRGTLWEPARALLDGAAIYPEPTRDEHRSSATRPSIHPLFIVASVPLTLLSLSGARVVALVLRARRLRVCGPCGSSRCATGAAYVIALSATPVVVHGLYYGNLTDRHGPAAVALAWRYRERAWIAGHRRSGLAVAAKLFVWPLVVWLLLTRRFRAAAWAIGSGVVLVLGSWALIGFEGFRDYPTLLRAVQDVYAERSLSVSTVAGALGASVDVAVAIAALVGLACIGVAAWLARGQDGDRRAFAVLVAACVLASPIVWPNYAALLFVPIAVTWPRLAPVWFFGT